MAYFAKAPIPGGCKTRLCPPLTTGEAAALYGAFLRQVVRPVPGAAAYVYGWPGEELQRLEAALPADSALPIRPQVGPDLWARMIGCFADLFEAQHGPIVLRNTDSPDLEMALVTEALERCEPGVVVLGPDFGGGYYLIGLAEPCPELFTDLDEGAPTVFDGTCRRAAELGMRVEALPPRADVDTFDDLIEMWRHRLGPDS